VDLGIILTLCIIIMGLGTYFFNKSEAWILFQYIFLVNLGLKSKIMIPLYTIIGQALTRFLTLCFLP
jgi:hypothetical protein